MFSEKDSTSIPVNAQMVTDGFRAAGAAPGDTLFYHGSLRSMGMVEDGPRTVIDGALEAAAPHGTIAMPTLWYHVTSQRPEDFDVRTSPSWVGALSEGFRRDPRSVRSNNFSHSISAIGQRAFELTSGHDKCAPLHTPWSETAFSDGSPWWRLNEWNALYCFIGVDMLVCTMKHYCEARLVAEYLARAEPSRRDALHSRLIHFGVPGGLWPSYNSGAMGELFIVRGLVKTARIGSATILAIRTRTFVEETMTLLRNEPEKWYNKEFLEWHRECTCK